MHRRGEAKILCAPRAERASCKTNESFGGHARIYNAKRGLWGSTAGGGGDTTVVFGSELLYIYRMLTNRGRTHIQPNTHTHTRVQNTKYTNFYFTTFSLCVCVCCYFMRTNTHTRARALVNGWWMNGNSGGVEQYIYYVCWCVCVRARARVRTMTAERGRVGISRRQDAARAGEAAVAGGRRLRLRTSIICQRPRHGYTPRAARPRRHGYARAAAAVVSATAAVVVHVDSTPSRRQRARTHARGRPTERALRARSRFRFVRRRRLYRP